MKNEDTKVKAAITNEYVKPKLIAYGSVAKLTAASGTANGDGGQNMMV